MGHIYKILVPMDGSPSSIAGLSQAVTLAEDLGAGVVVLHVNAPDQFKVGSATSSTQSAQEGAEREMEEAITSAKRRLGERLRRRTDGGDPVRKILELAVAEKADLIVIGTHGRVGRLHALVGSVAEGVVRSASCPVLTVRYAAGDEESFSERVHGREGIASQARHPR